MTTKKNARCWYAEYAPYGLRTLSDGNTLMVFETKEERDEMVERLNGMYTYHVEGVARAITRKEASEEYRTQDLNDHEHKLEVNGIHTCAGRCFFEVGTKHYGPLCR